MFNFSDKLSALIAYVIKVLVSCLICKQNAEIALEVMNYSKDDRAMTWTDSFFFYVSCKSATFSGITLKQSS